MHSGWESILESAALSRDAEVREAIVQLAESEIGRYVYPYHQLFSVLRAHTRQSSHLIILSLVSPFRFRINIAGLC